MTNPFPSPEYVDLCIEHQTLLAREWEMLGPRKGDFYIVRRRKGDLLKVLISNRRGKEFNVWSRTHEKVFVPRQDQLEEILEGKGWAWRIAYYYGSKWDDRQYEATAAKFDAIHSDAKGTDDRDFVENVRGSTPTVALLNCLVEVIRKEQ